MSADGLRRARIIKMDVEGAEGAVVRGLVLLLADARPDLEIEIHTGRCVQLDGSGRPSQIRMMRAK